RSPDATDTLPTHGVPTEVRPLLDALNHLFARTQEMMARERRFTSDAAHELRSPLAALKVQTDVAQLSLDDPGAQSKALGQLHAGIDRASRLVDQLLTLSRLDSLDNLDDVEPVMMADLLQSAVLDIWHPAQQAGIDIRLNVNAPEVMRHGQPLLLSLLARNLLDNAVRYSPRGSVVDVTLHTQSFTVRDNGPGISSDALARLGERFYRPPGQDATGSGLGLSIVKRIAALHGTRRIPGILSSSRTNNEQHSDYQRRERICAL
ncbi:MAG: ATP-binding protein, partial [Enterobacter hormaechei]|nr:ATP-binding protein [Enterobacter hormaechei]